MDKHSASNQQPNLRYDNNSHGNDSHGNDRYHHYSQQPGTSYSESDRPVAGQSTYSAESLLLSRLTTEIDGLKQAIATQRHQSSTEVNRLRKQVRWLTGLSAVAIVLLGGSLIGVSLHLRQEQIALRESQQQLVAQVEVLQAERLDSEQLNRLESLLSNLNQTTGSLQGQAQQILEQLPQASREQLESLQNDLEELQENVQGQLSQEEGGIMDRVNGLYQRIQDMLSGGDNTNESPAESPAESQT